MESVAGSSGEGSYRVRSIQQKDSGTYRWRLILTLGVTQMLVGGFCLISQVAGMLVDSGLHFIGHGFWCGTFFFICGIFGYLSGIAENKSYMRSYQVMSIVSVCVFVSVVVLCGVVGITTDIQSYKYWHRQPYSHLKARITVNGILILLAGIEAVVASVSAIVCSKPNMKSSSYQVNRATSNTGSDGVSPRMVMIELYKIIPPYAQTHGGTSDDGDESVKQMDAASQTSRYGSTTSLIPQTPV